MVLFTSSAVLAPQAMVKYNTMPMVYDNSQPARIGLLRRDAANADEMQWFNVRPLLLCCRPPNSVRLN